MWRQMRSHISCSTFGKHHEAQGFIQVQTEIYIYNPEQFPKPNGHQLVRHTHKKTLAGKT